MTFAPKLQTCEYVFKTIDSHTMGEPTRILYEGFPELRGNTMMEKKQDLMTHWDHLRRAIMLEPRGHRDMFGALLTAPTDPQADIGVIFMESGGYLNMCGHGSMGVCAMAVETGLVPVTEPYTTVVLDTPSGLIRSRVRVENGRAQEVTILNVPAFLYREGQKILLFDGREIRCDISFGGSFFALVDADALNIPLETGNAEKLSALGMEILKKVNAAGGIHHPELPITTVDLVEFYSRRAGEGASMRNCVVFGDAQVDRSPCGTGTSAKLAALYAKGKLGLHEKFIYESITGSRFTGEIVGTAKAGGFDAVLPQITGCAYITGLNQWVLQKDDPLKLGFLLG